MDAGTRVSHYRIERQLGEGGMGQVFLANDEVLGRHVALKFIRDDDAAAAGGTRQLWHEALAAAALDHPFICKIFEVGESPSGAFIAMEYVDGQTLAERLSSSRIATSEALDIAVEIAEALDVAHRSGVVHRDLKPANVMLTSDGHTKIMDFGVAKRLDVAVSPSAGTLSTVAAGGGSPGTLAYMSPEQVLGRPVDARSDLFSLGILLYELFAGVHPFRRDTPLGMAAAIASDPAPHLSEQMSGTPQGLEPIIDRLLAKAPGERYESARELVADLRRLRTPPAPDLTPAPKPAAPFWRHPRIVAAVVITLAAILIAAYAIVQQRPALAFQERDWIVLAEVDNQTGDAAFDRALDSALSVSIQQSRYVNVLPRGRIADAARRAGRTADKLDPALASDVAQREGARAVLAASINQVGSGYVLAAHLIDPTTQQPIASSTVNAATKNDVLASLDELATRVRRQLGESMPAIAQQRLPLLRATTSSLDALKLYAEGGRLAGNGQNEGYKLIEEAIRLDPDFALAHAALGLRGYLTGNRPYGEEHFQKALSLADRLTVRERLWIQALAEDSRGDRESAVDSYRAYVAAYPDDSDGWFRLGWTLLAALERPEEAAEAFNQVLHINPGSAGAYVNVATCYRALGRHPESLTAYRKAFEMRPQLLTERFVNHEFGFALVIAGEHAEARQTFEKLASNADRSLQASGLRSLGLLDMYQGRYTAALEHLGSAVLLMQNKATALSELRNRLFVVVAARGLGRTRRVAAEMAAVDRLIAQNTFEPGMLSIAGVTHVRLGNLQRARAVRARMTAAMSDRLAQSAVNRSSRLDEAVTSLVDGEIALAEGHAEDAIALFRTSLRLNKDAGAQAPLARALIATGRKDDAAGVLNAFIERMPLGGEEQEPWILAHLELGKLREAMGDHDKARALYEKLLAIWKDADPELRAPAETRARLAALR